MQSIYSAAISCQQFARPFARVPRFVWTILCFIAILLLGLAGRNQLYEYLQDFLSLLGYWATVFFVIIFTEHMLFRKGKIENYDLDGWNDPARLPHGIAAFCAFVCGVISFVMGMVSFRSGNPRRIVPPLTLPDRTRPGLSDLWPKLCTMATWPTSWRWS